MAASRAPKQWQLSKDETINSFTSWKENILYTLSLDANFAPYLEDGETWGKKTSTNPNRGYTSDPNDQLGGRTAVQKCAKLELMLGQIANYCTVISRNAIVKNSTSLNDVWSKIREHYGFQSNGSRFLDLYTIELKVGERYEDLYQRLLSFFDDNLLTAGSITHHGDNINVDEEMSPTVENVVVFLWLQKIHEGLPALVKQRYGAELRNQTLASIKPEISQALDSLLDELKSNNDAKIMRTRMSSSKFNISGRNNNHNNNQTRNNNNNNYSNNKGCCLCLAANRSGYDTHFLSTCKFLPEKDKKFMARIRQIECLDDDTTIDEYSDEISPPSPAEPTDIYFDSVPHPPSINRRVTTRKSPHLKCFFQHIPIEVCLDSGAETNLVSEQFTIYAQIQIKPTTQGANQADGKTSLDSIGEIDITITHGSHTLHLNALVIRNLASDVIAGEPFLEKNDVGVRSAKKQIIIKGRDVVYYDNAKSSSTTTRRITSAQLCRAPPSNTTILPGDFVEIPAPKDVLDETVAIEPRYISNSAEAGSWPPVQITEVIGGHIRLKNDTSEPIHLRRNDHFCQVRQTIEIDTNSIKQEPTPVTQPTKIVAPLNEIQVDPNNQLSDHQISMFKELHESRSEVFLPTITQYNDHSGVVRARVNFGRNAPPSRKLKVPRYSNSNLQELQDKFDQLEKMGAVGRPEELGITVEHVSPSFLVSKPSGGTRLVTSFASLGQYAKILPSVMPTVDDILRTIAGWKYLVKTDLKDSFYQIPLDKNSMKWCGTPTPFRGLRVYLVASQGMPGSSEVLEELMCTVFGDLIKTGSVAKIADDLYVGGNTIEELFNNWSMVLSLMSENDLKFKAAKTEIAPTHTTILGWEWNNGVLSASKHKVTPLQTCDPPLTVTKLRSFIGAYKVFNRVLRGCAKYLSQLEAAICGKQKQDKINWTEELLEHFRKAQAMLSEINSVTLPTPQDQLILVHDGSQIGIGSVLYIIRSNKMKIGGYFSAKLKPNQQRWLPCETEALSISTSVKHFSPYIRQSHHRTQILTDNRPCIQAWTKMCRGEFSASARVATFLTTLSDHNVDLHHIAGSYNLPSDFHSRNPMTCNSSSCQICTYISESENSAVRVVSADEILSGQKNLPYTNRLTWKSLQIEDPDLRRLHAYLSQGTRPSTKNTKSTTVKRYLNENIIIGRDGLLVKRQTTPFLPTRDLIVVPQSLLKGLLTSIHIRFDHPVASQLEKLVTRNFYGLKLHDTALSVVAACSRCQSLKTLPNELHVQSGTTPPRHPLGTFAIDVLRRHKQFILILRDTFSSFTVTQFIESEQHDDIREGIIMLISNLRPSIQSPVKIRVDTAPGLQSLKQDAVLSKLNIQLDFGRIKNPNKNPVAEKCVRELGNEILHLNPDGGPISPSVLSIATANLNMRIRNRGLSAWEIIHQRDQFDGSQLPFMDQDLANKQEHIREMNRQSSSKHKSKGGSPANKAPVEVGSLVYIKREGDKTKSREKYIVTNVANDLCQVQKFTKDQLRSRRYDVLFTEIIPISSDMLPDDLRYPVRGIEKDDSDDDFVSPASHPIPPSDIPVQNEFFNHTDSVPEEEAIINDNPLRRSSRKKNLPTRLSKDYFLY